MTTFYQEPLQCLLTRTTANNSLPFQCRSARHFSTTGDAHQNNAAQVLESEAAVNSSTPPGGIGSFVDDMGGGVDGNGWMSCTDSLGFERSDERRADGEIDCDIQMSSSSRLADNYDEELYRWKRSRNGETSSRWSKVGDERREAKKFPPPLSSMNIHGQPRFFLLPERKDGRLELTEVRIERPEILRASREDGRLRLHLLRDQREGLEETKE